MPVCKHIYDAFCALSIKHMNHIYQFNLPYIWYMDRSSVVYIYKWNSTLYDVQCHLNFMLSTISCYACFLSSLWYNYHRYTVISFTVWPVYAINNVVLCIVAHTFMIQLSPFYAHTLFLFCLKCMIQLSPLYTGNISFFVQSCFTVWPVYALHNAVLCIFAHTCMLSRCTFSLLHNC